MTKITTLIFVLIPFLFYSQHELHETDTSLSFKKEFYKNDVISLDQHYSYFDSTLRAYNFISEAKIDSNTHNLDTSKVVLLKQGKWKINTVEKGKNFYILANYENDLPIGKGYKFNSDNHLVSTYTRYPMIKDSVFNGYQEINYDKNQNIRSIEYHKFDEDQTLMFYWNTTYYYKNGTIEKYYFHDEENSANISRSYNKDSQLTSEYVRNKHVWYEKKWRCKRKRLKVTEWKKGHKEIKVYRNGKLVKEKIK